jgi:predicted PurR-regulated permease PerM
LHAGIHSLPGLSYPAGTIYGDAMGDTDSRTTMVWFFLVLFLISILLLGWLLWPFVSIIIIASVVTGIFSPIYNIFNRRLRPTIASLATCFLVFLLLFIPIVFFVGVLSTDAYNLYQTAKSAVFDDTIKNLLKNSQVLEQANRFLTNFNVQITGKEFSDAISETGKIVGLFLYQQASAIASNVFDFIVNFFFMLLIVFYLLIDGPRLIAFIVDLSPLPDDQDEKLINKFKDMAGAILIGNGLGGLVQGISGGMTFAFFGFNSPFLWGVIMGLLAFLPIVGIGVVFIPAAGYLLFQGRIGAGIFFIVFYFFLSGGVEYFIKPKVVGQRVKMHTLLVFLSIMGGLKLFGILGIIYGPLVVTGFLTLTDIYYASYRLYVDSAQSRSTSQ